MGVAVAAFTEGQYLNFAVPASYVAALLKKMGKPRPLSTEPSVQEKPKAATILGSNSTEGVSGTNFQWGGNQSITFGIRNQTASSVKVVHFLGVFLGADNKPVDYVEGWTCPEETFFPNLAKRQDLFSSYRGEYPNCTVLVAHQGVPELTRKVEIRVLDFKVAE